MTLGKIMWPFPNADDAFRDSVRKEFGQLATECGAKLVQIDPLLFGFRTPHAVLTIGAYPGHFRSLCVKLRSSEKEESVCVKDGADIGLANIELFVSGRVSEVYSERNEWSASALRKEVEALASKVREVAMPFLASSSADWDAVRDMIAARVSRMFEEKPWLKRYGEKA